MTKGTLYGVGTGPGDPQLVTRIAWSLIESAQVIAYPAPDDGVSFARSIVADAISADAIEIPMVVPMRSGRMPAQSIYDQGAEPIKTHLDAGRDVIVLCEGDPLFYGSFMYLLARLRDYDIEIIPGITSMTACAAAEAHPLVARNDILTILPAPLDDATLEAGIKSAEAVVIIKVGRHLGRIRSLFDRLGYGETARYVSHASLPHQNCHKLSDAPDDAPYFSMIILYKGDDQWL